jgi:bifunctional DNA-binding transcriptional regulator/antitoxin component of YhaV-PrlF toxin-antitoxin module
MKVQKTKNDQFIITIPKALAKALGYNKGLNIDFTINKEGNLVIIKKNSKKQ